MIILMYDNTLVLHDILCLFTIAQMKQHFRSEWSRTLSNCITHITSPTSLYIVNQLPPLMPLPSDTIY